MYTAGPDSLSLVSEPSYRIWMGFFKYGVLQIWGSSNLGFFKYGVLQI
jgi:hypothetical protein